ncbi:MAG TPA: hypothetical protein VGB77_14950 [Abditibacteriaceae bacterium]|jgi:hypothetical protein
MPNKSASANLAPTPLVAVVEKHVHARRFRFSVEFFGNCAPGARLTYGYGGMTLNKRTPI